MRSAVLPRWMTPIAVAALALGLAPFGAAQAAPPTPGPAASAAKPRPAVPEEDALVRQGAPSPEGGRVQLSQSAVQAVGDMVGSLNVVGGSDVVPDSSVSTLASVADRTITRVAGQDRYLTNVATSREVFPEGAKVVLVVSGENFPDGLAASSVAVALGGPLILTRAASLPAATAAEITRLAPEKVIVAGASGAVFENVVSSIRAAVPSATVVRAAGADRYGTAAALAQHLPPQPTGAENDAFVATGLDYPDALSVGPVAGQRSAPLLLTLPTALPTATRQSLAARRPSTTYVIGDQMSAAVLTAIRTATGGAVKVIGGPLRYDTAALVASNFYTATSPGVTIVPGRNFPDALSSASLAHRDRGPILLDPGTGSPSPATVDQTRALSWFYPADGRIMRYIPVVHPDDDMSAMAVNEPTPRRYDVYVLLTSGSSSGVCNGTYIDNPWTNQQYIPQPQPLGMPLSDRCAKHRRDSWDVFYTLTTKETTPGYTSLTGQDVEWNGTPLPQPQRLDPQGQPVAATDIRISVGPNRAFVQFDLGALDKDKVMWAMLNTRLLRGTVLPDLPERDIVGAGYSNHTTTGSTYWHPDHDALRDTLATIDIGVPGSQYSPVGHVEVGRAFGGKVRSYCGYMCHPASLTGYVGSMGQFQYSFGWLRSGRWPSGRLDVIAGFSEYQSFAKSF